MQKQQVKYLAITDFDLIQACINSGLTPVQFRILHYINSCLAHGIKELSLEEAAAWLEIQNYELYLNIKALEAKGILHGFSFHLTEAEA